MVSKLVYPDIGLEFVAETVGGLSCKGCAFQTSDKLREVFRLSGSYVPNCASAHYKDHFGNTPGQNCCCTPAGRGLTKLSIWVKSEPSIAAFQLPLF